MMQTKWKALIDPFLSRLSLNSVLLQSVSLINGTTVVNHTLGRKLTGWRVVGIDAAATIYDQQASNPQPDLTLVLVSNAVAVVSLEVF